MNKIPVIDRAGCTECESCIAVCPAVFARNEVTGAIEIKELDGYPEAEVDEAIKMCPADCIRWSPQA